MTLVNWLTLAAFSIFAGSWVGYLTVKAINGMCYEIEILRRYIAESKEDE